MQRPFSSLKNSVRTVTEGLSYQSRRITSKVPVGLSRSMQEED